MRRRTRQPAISGKMYRHFAAITVCLTSALAILADGENRAAVAEELDQQQERAALERADVEKFGQPKLVMSGGGDAPQPTGDFYYGDVSSDFGAPMDRAGSRASDAAEFAYGSASGSAETGIDYAALGVTQEQFEKLDPSERQQLLDEFQALRARQARSLLEGSAARGGGALEL